MCSFGFTQCTRIFAVRTYSLPLKGAFRGVAMGRPGTRLLGERGHVGAIRVRLGGRECAPCRLNQPRSDVRMNTQGGYLRSPPSGENRQTPNFAGVVASACGFRAVAPTPDADPPRRASINIEIHSADEISRRGKIRQPLGRGCRGRRILRFSTTRKLALEDSSK